MTSITKVLFNVYQKAKSFCRQITMGLRSKSFDSVTNDQLRRASFIIMLNIAEGSSRFSSRDRLNFMVISRGSAFKCVAILEYLYEMEEISKNAFEIYLTTLDEISRMFYAIIRKLGKSE
jgi:four helix bundle protein